MRKTGLLLIWLALSLSLVQQTASAQSTEFTYQGRLLFGGAPANGSHDFEFRLFSDPDGNAQVGLAIPLTAVNVVNGVFSVRLDFGNQFPGAHRYLEIRVRQAGQEFYAVLAPRQAITSAPYAVKSLTAESATNSTNAAQLGGLTANQFVLTNDLRMSDARAPLPNSPNYIQNSSVLQASSNFNISGNGTVGGTLSGNVISAVSQYNIGNIRVLSAASDNTSVGIGTGALVGSDNSFFGFTAGEFNISGTNNSYFGSGAGVVNNSGSNNSLFGYRAGAQSRTSNNSFFGRSAGESNTTGMNNSFFGVNSGLTNQTGQLNTLLGGHADVGSNNLINATAVGFQALVAQNNSLILGSISGVNGADADTSVGIGTTTPSAKLEVRNGEIRSTGATGGRFAAYNPNNQNARVLFDWFNDGTNDWPRIRYGGSGEGALNGFLIQGANDSTKLAILNNGNIGIGTISPTEKLQVSGNANVSGNLIVSSVRLGNSGCAGTPGSTPGGAISFTSLSCSTYSLAGDGSNTFLNAPGGAISFRVGGAESMRVNSTGQVSILTLGSGGSTALCRNGSNHISVCSSSLRYKSSINSFSSGLPLIKRLRPVSFIWKQDNASDFGLVAEEVAEAEPLLVTRNDRGDVEGVKYDRLGVVLINAVQEQQQQIETQQKRIEEQQDVIRGQLAEIEKQRREFAELKKLVCAQNPTAELCQAKK